MLAEIILFVAKNKSLLVHSFFSNKRKYKFILEIDFMLVTN